MPRVAYGPIFPEFIAGDEIPHPTIADRVAIVKSNDMFVCVTDTGQLEERPTAGEWESFRVGGNYYTAERGSALYVFPRAVA